MRDKKPTGSSLVPLSDEEAVKSILVHTTNHFWKSIHALTHMRLSHQKRH